MPGQPIIPEVMLISAMVDRCDHRRTGWNRVLNTSALLYLR
jgi:hypothetical protein